MPESSLCLSIRLSVSRSPSLSQIGMPVFSVCVGLSVSLSGSRSPSFSLSLAVVPFFLLFSRFPVLHKCLLTLLNTLRSSRRNNQRQQRITNTASQVRHCLYTISLSLSLFYCVTAPPHLLSLSPLPSSCCLSAARRGDTEGEAASVDLSS